jgi:hypothetical protein
LLAMERLWTILKVIAKKIPWDHGWH